MRSPRSNELIAVFFVIVALSGIVLFVFLPSGIKEGGYQTLLGIPKTSWLFIHNWSGIIFIILILLHFILHWNWITHRTNTVFKKKKNKESK